MSLQNLNVLAIGDSLFAGTGWNPNKLYCPIELQWISQLATKYNWNFTNLGIAGQTISFNPDLNFSNNYAIKSIYQALCYEQFYNYGTPLNYHVNTPEQVATGKTNNQVNLILLEGGCNDFGLGVPYVATKKVNGATVENLVGNPHCFKNAYKLIIDKLLIDYPNALICCIIPWHSNGTTYGSTTTMTHPCTGQPLERTAYYKAPVELKQECYANNNRVGYLDLGNPEICGFTPSKNITDEVTGENLAYDNFHLTPHGMNKIMDKAVPWIKSLLAKGFDSNGAIIPKMYHITFIVYGTIRQYEISIFETFDSITLKELYENFIYPEVNGTIDYPFKESFDEHLENVWGIMENGSSTDERKSGEYCQNQFITDGSTITFYDDPNTDIFG